MKTDNILSKIVDKATIDAFISYKRNDTNLDKSDEKIAIQLEKDLKNYSVKKIKRYTACHSNSCVYWYNGLLRY